MDDAAVVSRQLGREPRGTWRVAMRCTYGYPAVIATAPVLEDGAFFPTLYYLTCPHLTEAVSAVESAGGHTLWRTRLAADAEMVERMQHVDAVYRSARAAEAGGVDPVPEVGIAGQRDPLGIKCLHAHVASALAGIDDPVGHGVLAGLMRECGNERCRELV